MPDDHTLPDDVEVRIGCGRDAEAENPAERDTRTHPALLNPVDFAAVLGARLHGDDPFAGTKACDEPLFDAYVAAWAAAMEQRIELSRRLDEAETIIALLENIVPLDVDRAREAVKEETA